MATAKRDELALKMLALRCSQGKEILGGTTVLKYYLAPVGRIGSLLVKGPGDHQEHSAALFNGIVLEGS